MNPLWLLALMFSGGPSTPSSSAPSSSRKGRTTLAPEVAAVPSSAPPDGQPWDGPELFLNGYAFRLVHTPVAGYVMHWASPTGWTVAAAPSPRADLAVRAAVRVADAMEPGPGLSVPFPDPLALPLPSDTPTEPAGEVSAVSLDNLPAAPEPA